MDETVDPQAARDRLAREHDRVEHLIEGLREGRIVPFCRLNLTGDPVAEARRAIGLGARGIKLHPRAQAFSVDDERLVPVFEIAAEHRIPILIHAGRGMPPIGEALATAAERNPDATLILAHAAIVDQDRIASLVAGRPNVVFDASRSEEHTSELQSH